MGKVCPRTFVGELAKPLKLRREFKINMADEEEGMVVVCGHFLTDKKQNKETSAVSIVLSGAPQQLFCFLCVLNSPVCFRHLAF